MATAIIAKGKPNFKTVEGQRRLVTPCVVLYGSDDGGGYHSFGIGFFYGRGRRLRRGGQVWGLMMPQILLQSWRGMKILEGVKVINYGTLCACWTSGTPEMREDDYQRYVVDDLIKFNGEKVTLAARDRAFQATPSPQEWSRMLSKCKKLGADLANFDIKREIEGGYLKKKSTLNLLVPTSEAERQKRRRKKPLAHEQRPSAPQPVQRVQMEVKVPVAAPPTTAKRRGLFSWLLGRQAA